MSEQPMESQHDEYHGAGGCYVIDPETGLRRLADPSENERPIQQPAQPNEYHGKGGAYRIDPETGQPKPHTGREHLLIKPARPPAPAIPKPESEPKPAQPISKKKTKRGAK